MTRTCIWCNKKFELEDLKDDLSRKEALISGFCQECQDKTFKEDEDE